MLRGPFTEGPSYCSADEPLHALLRASNSLLSSCNTLFALLEYIRDRPQQFIQLRDHRRTGGPVSSARSPALLVVSESNLVRVAGSCSASRPNPHSRTLGRSVASPSTITGLPSVTASSTLSISIRRCANGSIAILAGPSTSRILGLHAFKFSLCATRKHRPSLGSQHDSGQETLELRNSIR
jgi:hypothetical protein